MVQLRLLDEPDFRREGRMDFVDSGFDARSGTIRGRAVVPNPDLFLTPGSFARLRLFAGEAPALMVPDAAVMADQVRPHGADGRAATAPSRRARSCSATLVDGLRVVRSGLAPDDRVIIGGLHRARPGARVTAELGRIGPSPMAAADSRRPEGHRAMRLAQFFIDRPVFAAVLSIAITLVGGIAAWRLPIAEYPDIAPPTVQVTALYPGASAETIAATVAGPIEQEVNGVDGHALPVVPVHRRRPADDQRGRSSRAPTSTRRRCWCRTASPSPSRGCPRRCGGSASP